MQVFELAILDSGGPEASVLTEHPIHVTACSVGSVKEQTIQFYLQLGRYTKHRKQHGQNHEGI